jgi:hypothetical protein
MSPRSPICVSTAQPSDSGTLHRGRTISPAERHRHLRRNNAVLLHRSRSVEREVKNLHKEYRKAVVQARGTTSRRPSKAASPSLSSATPSKSAPGNENTELAEKIQEASSVLTPGAFDIEELLSKLTVTRRLEPQLEEIGEECAAAVKETLAMFQRAQELHMSPIRLVGENYSVMVARCNRLIFFFEGLEKFFKYGGPILVTIDLIRNCMALWHAIKNHDLHDGGRTIAFHVTNILILAFVSITAIFALICAAFGIAAELAVVIAALAPFGAIIGVAALPFVLLAKPPENYAGTPFEQAFDTAKKEGNVNSKEYMEAVHEYLHHPSSVNLIHMNAIRDAR